MKTLLLLFITFSIVISCNKDNQQTQSGGYDPFAEASLVKEMKKSLTNCQCEISIIKGTYNSQLVYFIALTDPICDGINAPTLYDINGKVVRSFTMNDYHDFYNNVTLDKVLYRCKTTN